MASDPQPPRPGRKVGLLSGLDWQLVTGIFLLVIAVLLALGVLVVPRVWILAGVRSLGVDLGGMTRAQAVAALQEEWDGQLRTWIDGEEAWIVHLSELGLVLDAEGTVQAALEQGDTLDNLGARMCGDASIDVVPIVAFDSAAAKRSLQALRPDIDVSPVNTSLRLVNGRIEASDPQPGRSLDVPGTMAWLEENSLAIVETGHLHLVIHPVPPLAFDVSDVVTRANEWLARTVSLQAYDPITDETLTWTIAPERWGSWVSMSVDPVDPTRLDWTLDDRAAAAAVVAWEASLGGGRLVDSDRALLAIQDAIINDVRHERLRIYHLPSPYTVQFGETLSSISRKVGIPYPWIEQANPGVSDSLSVGQVLTIPSPDVLLPLPVVENKRIIVSLSAQRMWAYENGVLLWEWPVSTGIPSSPTAPGVFQVQYHDPNAYAASWDLWMPHFIGIYRPVPTSDFMNGFHGFPTRDGASLLWTGDLGRPVTFGCILLGHTSAPLLFEWAEQGVIVEIRE